jgi:hypothetical protein
MNRFVATAAATAVVALAVGGSATEAAFVVTADPARPLVNGLEQITFRVSAATGANLLAPGSADPADDQDAISTLDGTFSVVGGAAALSVPGTAAQYPARTTNISDFEASGDPPANPPRSFANFPSTAGAIVRSPDANLTASLDGVWFTTNFAQRIRPLDTTPADGFDQTLLARVFVTPGAQVSFDGVFQSYNSVDGPISFTSAAVPEPASAGLLMAAGLVATSLAGRRHRVRG